MTVGCIRQLSPTEAVKRRDRPGLTSNASYRGLLSAIGCTIADIRHFEGGSTGRTLAFAVREGLAEYLYVRNYDVVAVRLTPAGMAFVMANTERNDVPGGCS